MRVQQMQDLVLLLLLVLVLLFRERVQLRIQDFRCCRQWW